MATGIEEISSYKRYTLQISSELKQRHKRLCLEFLNQPNAAVASTGNIDGWFLNAILLSIYNLRGNHHDHNH
ncbi:MAG: hypothetical protein AAGA67_09760 [Cyanobacteria bacterium P01_F01_bin.153]